MGFDRVVLKLVLTDTGKLARPIKESILVSSENNLEALFVTQGLY